MQSKNNLLGVGLCLGSPQSTCWDKDLRASRFFGKWLQEVLWGSEDMRQGREERSVLPFEMGWNEPLNVTVGDENFLGYAPTPTLIS